MMPEEIQSFNLTGEKICLKKANISPRIMKGGKNTSSTHNSAGWAPPLPSLIFSFHGCNRTVLRDYEKNIAR